MKIRSKIICGYALALGIASVGTATGLFVGNHHQQKALQARQSASQERKLLSTLQVDILYNRPAKQLIPHLQNPQMFHREGMKLIERIDKIQIILVNHNRSVKPSTLEGLQPLLEDYEITVAKFAKQVRNVVAEIDALLVTSTNNGKQKAEKLVVNLVKSQEFVNFIEFPNKLSEFYELAGEQENYNEIYLFQAEKNRTQIIVVSLAISIAIAIFLAFYISRTIAYPIQNLNKIALQVTKEANFALQVPVESKDEVGLLASSFNQLIYRVNQLLQEQQVYTEKLEHTTELAETANLAKSEFLANMSHELRTPLNGILGYAQILNNSQELKEKERHGVKIIYQCGSHLLTLINDVLDLSKIEARKLELEFDDIHFPSFLQGVMEICRVRADKKGINFVYQADDNLPIGILADEKRLRQVLINLLSNAIKFTDSGSVFFRINSLDSSGENMGQSIALIRFEVEDTGIGIKEQQSKQIFQPFEQVGDQKRQSEGAGLGLAISQRIVGLMGSKIEIESQLGVGSNFSFAVGLVVSDDWVQQVSVNDGKQITGYQGAVRRILIVDDKWENRSVLMELLKPLGFKLTEAENGQEALFKARQQKFDLIITDIAMPIMNGFEMLKQLRNDSTIKDITTIISSVSVSDINRQMILDAGGDDFLPKPIYAEDLFALLAKHLKLTWKYDKNELKPTSTISDNNDTNLVLPTIEDLQILLELAENGLLIRLAKTAEEIAQKNSSYLPFSQKISRLAKQFETEQIEALLERCLESEQFLNSPNP